VKKDKKGWMIKFGQGIWCLKRFLVARRLNITIKASGLEEQVSSSKQNQNSAQRETESKPIKPVAPNSQIGLIELGKQKILKPKNPVVDK
jgi:hypothetical protein